MNWSATLDAEIAAVNSSPFWNESNVQFLEVGDIGCNMLSLMSELQGTVIFEKGERQYATLAYMSQRFGLDWRTLRDAAEEIGVKPDFELNDVAYYAMAGGVERLMDHLVNSGLLRLEFHLPAAGPVKIKDE